MKDAAKQYKSQFEVANDGIWEQWRDQLEYWINYDTGRRTPEDDWCPELPGMIACCVRFYFCISVSLLCLCLRWRLWRLLRLRLRNFLKRACAMRNMVHH